MHDNKQLVNTENWSLYTHTYMHTVLFFLLKHCFNLIEISCLKKKDEKILNKNSHFFKEVTGSGINKAHQSFAFSTAHVLCVSRATIWVMVPAAIFIVFAAKFVLVLIET